MVDESRKPESKAPEASAPDSARNESSETSAPTDALAANDAFLDEKLAQPILRGDKGIDKAQVWAGAFLVLVAGLIAYSNAFRMPFHAEDQRLICENAGLHSLATLAEGVSQQPSMPFAMLTFAANWWVAPGNPVAFHAVNILLFLAGGMVLFLLLRALLPDTVPVPVCMTVAMLYVLHPAHTVYVDYVVGRFLLLGLLFTWLSLLLYVRGSREGGMSPGALGGVLFCAVIAHYSGVSMLGVLLLMLAIDLLSGGVAEVRRNLGAYTLSWAVFGVVILTGVVTAYAANQGTPEGLAWGTTILNAAIPAVPDAFGLLKTSNLLLTVFAVAVMASGALLYRFRLAALAKPELRVAWGLAVAALLLALGVATFQRNLYWTSELALWTDASEKHTDAAEPKRQVGRLLLAQPVSEKDTATLVANAKEAEKALRASLDIDKDNVKALTALGAALARQALALQGDEVRAKENEARDAYLSALENDIGNKDATVALALLAEAQAARSTKKSDLADTAEYYKRAEVLDALSPELKARYGMTLAALGRFEEAEKTLSAIPVAPDDKASPISGALKNVRDALKRCQDLDTQALSIQQRAPADPAVPKMMAQSLLVRGRELQAYYLMQRLMQSPAADFGAWILTGLASARLGMGDQFASEYPAPAAKPAEVASAWIELARACAGDNLWSEATRYLESPAATAETGQPASMALASVAEQLKQTARAIEYLQQAATAMPQSPVPWLRLCDLAAAAKDHAAASKYLSEAASRGAADTELAPRRVKIGLPAAGAPSRTVIQ